MKTLVVSVYIYDPPLRVRHQVMVLVQRPAHLRQNLLQLVRTAVRNILQSGLQSSDLASHCFPILRPSAS